MTPKVFERTYLALKREVTSGQYTPGQRLQARSLADTLKTSTSPVTNAMRQLVGEEVLEYSDRDSFIIPWVTERRLRDLFTWSAWLTSGNLIDPLTTGSSDSSLLDWPVADLVGAIERLFLAAASLSGNTELIRSVSNLNDRLRPIRRLETQIFHDTPDETEALLAAWNERNQPALRKALARYHRRRIDAVPQFVSLSYQERR